MTVTLKNVGIREVPVDFDNPFGATIEILWEVQDGLEWRNKDNKYSKVIHKRKPVVLEPAYKSEYIRTSNSIKEVTYGL